MEKNYPHTYESGITVLRRSDRNACLISDGINVTWIQGKWIREDGTLTNNGVKALINSTDTLEDYNNLQEQRRLEKIRREEEWKKKKEEGAKLVSYTINKGILHSEKNSYKYIAGKGLNMYHKTVHFWGRLPKSQVVVEKAGDKVIVTLPKWLAEKHQLLFTK